MTTATLEYNLNDDKERLSHEHAPNGWRYKLFIDELLKKLGERAPYTLPVAGQLADKYGLRDSFSPLRDA